MAKSIFILSVLLTSVSGNAFPKPTPAARLEERQQVGIAVVFSPSINGLTTTWAPYGLAGSVQFTVTSSASRWGFCAVTTSNCALPTACSNGTLSLAGSSTRVCDATANLCGTEYLYVSLSASTRATRLACFPSTDSGRTTSTYLVTPPSSGNLISSSSSTTRPSSSTSPSSSPTSPPLPPSKKAPIGAIVGGVVGGLAVIILLIFAVFCVLKRRRSSREPAHNPHTSIGGDSAFTGAATGGMTQQHYSDQSQQQYYQSQPNSIAYYDPKHASYASSYPSSPPPPTYPEQSGYTNQQYYQPPKDPISTAATSPNPGGYGFANDQGGSPVPLHGGQAYNDTRSPHDNFITHELPAHNVNSPVSSLSTFAPTELSTNRQ